MKRVTVFLLILTVCLIFLQSSCKRKYKSFNEFYNYIAKSSSLKSTHLKLEDTLTTKTIIGKDTIQEIFSFKAANLNLKYFSIEDTLWRPTYYEPSYFTLNDKKIPIDTAHKYSGFGFYLASKINLNGTLFLFINGYIKDCTGSFCRMQFDNCFQIRADKITFHIISGLQQPENIYCDINNDGNLDQICFFANASAEINNNIEINPNKYYLGVSLLTLKNDSWIPMTDKNNKPYYIYFQSDDYINFDTFKILDYNWMFEL